MIPKAKKSAEEVVLPLNEDKKELDSKQSQIEDLRKQLAASEAGRLAKDKAVNNGEAERQAAQLEAQRKAVRAERILNGAKSIFGGLAYAPPSGSQYTVEYNAGPDVYASTSSNMFSPNDAKQPAASALYRNDGGITQPGVHPYFTKRAEEQVQQQKLTAVNSSKVESGDTEVDPERIVFNSGEIVYARTTLPIDSDIPGPIRIRMLTGKAKGAIGFGSISLVEQASGVALKLDSVILNGKPIQAKAWALSPETELALFDEHVDHHYIQRFGGLFAGLFMTGFLDSLIETTVTNGNGSTTTTTGGIEGTKERIVYSLASAAQGFLPILYDAASRPIQVKIPKGTPMYLLFEEQVLDTDLIERKSQSELLQEMVNEPKDQESEGTQSKVDITPQTTRATNNSSNGASVNLAIETDGQKIKLWE